MEKKEQVDVKGRSVQKTFLVMCCCCYVVNIGNTVVITARLTCGKEDTSLDS